MKNYSRIKVKQIAFYVHTKTAVICLAYSGHFSLDTLPPFDSWKLFSSEQSLLICRNHGLTIRLTLFLSLLSVSVMKMLNCILLPVNVLCIWKTSMIIYVHWYLLFHVSFTNFFVSISFSPRRSYSCEYIMLCASVETTVFLKWLLLVIAESFV